MESDIIGLYRSKHIILFIGEQLKIQKDNNQKNQKKAINSIQQKVIEQKYEYFYKHLNKRLENEYVTNKHIRQFVQKVIIEYFGGIDINRKNWSWREQPSLVEHVIKYKRGQTATAPPISASVIKQIWNAFLIDKLPESLYIGK